METLLVSAPVVVGAVRASLIGGVAPLLMLAGLAVLLLAVPAVKERIADLTGDRAGDRDAERAVGAVREFFYGPAPQVTEPHDTPERDERRWQGSRADQFDEFFDLVAADEQTEDNTEDH